jgi:3-methyl-2-oxobutanoate hydroxymethyltransferase
MKLMPLLSSFSLCQMEGGASMAPHVRTCVNGGVAVMGHIGLTPQRISVLGGFRAQGKTLAAAKVLLADALALQEAGAFALVIECVPAEVAELITKSLEIPTIGIGAGNGTSGQVLVYHDLVSERTHTESSRVSHSL